MNSAESHFYSYVKDQNFMTPTVVEVGWITEGEQSYELSKGEGLSGKPIFGVTVRPDEWEKLADKQSTLCYSATEARKYIERLQSD